MGEGWLVLLWMGGGRVVNSVVDGWGGSTFVDGWGKGG